MSSVGIDLSLTSTGLAAVTANGAIFLGNIKSKGTAKDTIAQRKVRIYDIANQVVDWVKAQGPDVSIVCIEAPSYGSRFGSAHDRSGLWWIVVGALLHDGYRVALVSPQGRAKYGSGAGNSKKPVVMAAVLETYGDITSERIKNDDEADAVLLAAMGARAQGFPVEPFELDEANLAAMEGVLWPTT